MVVWDRLEPGKHGGFQPIRQDSQDVQTIGGSLGGEHGDKVTMALGQGNLINPEHRERLECIPIDRGSDPAVEDTEQGIVTDILAYIWPMVRDFIRLRRRHFNLTIDGLRVQIRASEILVANGAFVNEPPFPYGPPEGFNDQQFDVYILAAWGLPDYLRLIWGMARGSWKGQTALQTLTIRESITIEAVRQQQPVQADGESIGYTPITVRLVPSAVRVIVPPYT